MSTTSTWSMTTDRMQQPGDQQSFTFRMRHPRELPVQDPFAAARLAEVAHAWLAVGSPETLPLGLKITLPALIPGNGFHEWTSKCKARQS